MVLQPLENEARSQGGSLSSEKVAAAEKLIKAGMTPGQAAKQLNIGRATAYRIAKTIQ